MCGRYFLISKPHEVAAHFQVELPGLIHPRYNIAPTQPALCVRASREGGREAVIMRWGLVPSWADDPAIGSRMINARAETAAEKPSFRAAMKYRRCLVPADGFYEWRKVGTGKQPYAVRLRGGGLFAMAGLWEQWERGEGALESFTILTTSANEAVRVLHERMPVILPPERYAEWLAPDVRDAAAVAALLVPCSPEALEVYPVSTRVNSPGNDSPELLVRVPDAISDG
jgi:putative SOS response-associated peptidase YedK